ncbi:hypothetical protein BUALT_Bualt08G0002700 [Buddleja alternifolia]|uniref:Uncharacterized protein n=1 Tax=Buddleja alternifolia TaxID=168488 RepID=A0AAV6X3W9_9LAMI|nr:hypothetical protein BUALT_Bualt08G0002700 [Buddleja alternifolia]
MPLIIIPAVCKEKGSPFGDPDVCHTCGMACASLALAGGLYSLSTNAALTLIMGGNLSKAVCKEKGSSFGNPDVCHTYGMAYASLTMAIGAIYLWSSVYNIVELSDTPTSKSSTESLLSSRAEDHDDGLSLLPQDRFENKPPDGAIPSLTLIMGGNLLKGLKGSGLTDIDYFEHSYGTIWLWRHVMEVKFMKFIKEREDGFHAFFSGGSNGGNGAEFQQYERTRANTCAIACDESSSSFECKRYRPPHSISNGRRIRSKFRQKP